MSAADRLRQLEALPGVAEGVEAAREACARLRFEEALRRRIPEAAAESRVRGARATAALEGAEVSLAWVRARFGGSPSAGDPVEAVAGGAVRATAESERVVGLVLGAPRQALARLHVAAGSGWLPEEVLGRPRVGGEPARDLAEVGRAPSGDELGMRLDGLVSLLAAASRPGVSGVLVAALVHAEIAATRPFVAANGLVARAMERAVLQASGVDGTGVAVPEVGHLAGGSAGYVGSLAAYASGQPAGVALWCRQAAGAVAVGAEEGVRICAAVRAGRLA